MLTYKFLLPMLFASIFMVGNGGVASGSPPSAKESVLDLTLAKATEHRRYFVELSPPGNPVKVGAIQSWTVTVSNADHTPMENAAFKIGGGMPKHGHGLPTAPAVTKQIGPGRYLIEGVKFNMRGWWVFDVAVGGPAGDDTVRFNLVL